MVATGFLRLDIAGYGGIAIADKGRALLRGEGEFLYREDTVIAQPRRANLATTRQGAERVPNGGDAALLAGLKALRLELAKERGVPAYIVFPDRTLLDMARRRPRTETEFAEVNGVGAAKLKQFAEPFLAAITTHCRMRTEGGRPEIGVAKGGLQRRGAGEAPDARRGDGRR